MSKRLAVVYEDRVFRPLELVDVREHQRGTVTLIEPEEGWLDTEYMDRYIWRYVKPDQQTLAEAVDELD